MKFYHVLEPKSKDLKKIKGGSVLSLNTPNKYLKLVTILFEENESAWGTLEKICAYFNSYFLM